MTALCEEFGMPGVRRVYLGVNAANQNATSLYESLGFSRMTWSGDYMLVDGVPQQKAIVVTTNLAFRDWHTIFPNAACAVGLIDRLTHHAALVRMRKVRHDYSGSRRGGSGPWVVALDRT